MDGHLSPGTLLLSAPEMLDPNFMHAVILMIHHDDDGAMGVVVNASMESRVGDALPEHPVLKDVDAPLWQGGPVGLDSLQVLHRHPPVDAGDLVGVPGVDVGDGVRVGADLDWASQAIARGVGDPGHVRFVVGYSGWAAGQLEDEIANDSWLPLDPCAELVFGEGSRGSIWRRAMARLQGGGSSLAHLPPDPSWN
jgi:putative transcriptional regulator